jgi:hypothetical protein
VDRRFGEGDDSLTQEEKALMRFQKQRMKELSGSKFSLAEEDDYDQGGFQLTHEGKSLADALDDGDGGWEGDMINMITKMMMMGRVSWKSTISVEEREGMRAGMERRKGSRVRKR